MKHQLKFRIREKVGSKWELVAGFTTLKLAEGYLMLLNSGSYSAKKFQIFGPGGYMVKDKPAS